ncbi:N-formylglutamate amidohydrolase [Rhodovulum sulfidophilum]|uniref:N-formylglutamate amidohydrolase n=2 Tax=Rhodovulum sulfidophilum TaxID=35806 RepID=A0A0D6B730_RHOSU|nr:N-formylglutamate amidohydrolase [Rhodovulum sulfidophilum]ANB32980.1 N-formylglutamate amidohydrolase [Rhodovulum sulfidophilum DSM 1374]ANB36829.1 N-formylglutamate amidohydrolase [Rhodovulum sulfidophilum]MBK5925126.1 N-formylglutamate amidohydrolase [Rhodovulum sulfidophilum]MBL3552128.1 N-formylglutamate amidohydrolase [Rhodovulum sulfidophilum]MBL3562238.1 N-formylglutamate amidohydrolase [Rhodovulum sulfidophilum]
MSGGGSGGVQAFKLFRPDWPTTSVVFSSPHSGRDYPLSFLRKTVLDDRTIRSSEDAFIDILFSDAPGQGAPLLAASVPRAFIDLNRAAEELDPAVISGARMSGHNPRISSGLGVIPRVVANGRGIYRGKLAMTEAESRIETCWRPYHRQLESLVEEALARFGQSILIDCHSMPREAIESARAGGRQRPEVVLGDRFGTSAGAEIVDRIEQAFSGAGLRVGRNAPFAGAYITQRYGLPSRRRHAVQVEIDRSLYMDETEIRPNAGFDPLRRVLGEVVASLSAIGRPDDVPLAAE